MSDPLRQTMNIRAVIQEHMERAPELVALHPADLRLLRDKLNLSLDYRGGYSRSLDATELFMSPSFVADYFVPRGEAQVWTSAVGYRKHYEARSRRLSWRNN